MTDRAKPEGSRRFSGPVATGDQVVAKIMEICWSRSGMKREQWVTEICERSGIPIRTEGQVNKWKTGRTLPHPALLFAAADLAGLSLDEVRALAEETLGITRAGRSLVQELKAQILMLLDRVEELEAVRLRPTREDSSQVC